MVRFKVSVRVKVRVKYGFLHPLGSEHVNITLILTLTLTQTLTLTLIIIPTVTPTLSPHLTLTPLTDGSRTDTLAPPSPSPPP